MAKPEPERVRERARGAALLGLGVAVLAVTALAVCVLCLDTRRRDQLADLTDQLDQLRRLVDTMQHQLSQHEHAINSSIQARNTKPQEAAEEVVYDEEEYEYDEEGSYEYDDDAEPSPKATVKRTTVLSESRNFTEAVDSSSARARRDVSSQAVPVRAESATEALTNHNPSSEIETTHQRGQQSLHHLHSSGYQEQRRPEESVVRLRHRGKHRSAKMGDVELFSQHSGEDFEQPSEQQLLAGHFVGDASSYNPRDHSQYYGNNILYHPHGLFRDWAPSSWMIDLGILTYFPFHNGKLSIQSPGLYFVYAQIYYAATHDRCGFHIKHNGEEVAQCTTMTAGRMMKRNTCFTAVILHLNKSDLVWVSEVEGYRNTSFKSSHSFFGLMQLKRT